MTRHASRLLAALLIGLSPIAATAAAPPPATGAQPSADPQFTISAVTEKKVTQIPDGPLYWRIENFPTLAAAQGAAGATALAAEIGGKVWLFTLGANGGSSPGGSKVAEVGPINRIAASEYLLRINNAVAAPGTKTAVHSHPGTEAFYVLTGRLSQKTPQGVSNLEAGQSQPGYGPGTVMEVSNPGTATMNALVMFLVDAGKPFSTPAKFD